MPTERSSVSDKFPLGSLLPKFSLPNVDGSVVSEDYLRAGRMALVAFTCNHCPYVKGSERMLIDVVRQYQGSGLRAVAISSNDAVKYPEDGFDKMKEKAREMALPYPYLYDESQEIARKFDAACTPECYLFDAEGRLVFHGAINNSPKDPAKASERFLERAVAQLASGKTPEPAFVHPIGCSIKWR